MGIASQHSALRAVSTLRIGRTGTRKVLLAYGVAFPLLWIGMDLVASRMLDGYSYRNQTISELSAIGTSTRSFWLAGGYLYSLLIIAFGVGLWAVAGPKRALRLVAGLLILQAGIHMTLGPFSSMHQREVLASDGATFSDTLHLILVGVGGVIFLCASILAAAVQGTRFRIYTGTVILFTLVFGYITSLYASEVQADEPTPWLGIYERVSAYSSQLWFAVLAVVLWRHQDTPQQK